MKVLITGGAGYIGSMLTEELLSQGLKVTVLDNFMYGQDSLLHLCHNPNLTIVRGDVRDELMAKNLLKYADIVIPLACITGAPACDRKPIEAKQVNLGAITFLVKHASKEQKFIFPNTNSGYGIGDKESICTEKSRLNPVSYYGRLKVEAEDVVMSRVNSIAFRLATVFGVSPRMRLDLLVNDFVYRACKDSSLVLFESHFRRNFLYIGDCVKAYSFTLNNFDRLKGNVFNLGCDQANMRKEELCTLIKEYMPRFNYVKSEFTQDIDKRDYWVSSEKLKSHGFEAKVRVDQGIKELIKAFQFINKNTYTNI